MLFLIDWLRPVRTATCQVMGWLILNLVCLANGAAHRVSWFSIRYLAALPAIFVSDALDPTGVPTPILASARDAIPDRGKLRIRARLTYTANRCLII